MHYKGLIDFIPTKDTDNFSKYLCYVEKENSEGYSIIINKTMDKPLIIEFELDRINNNLVSMLEFVCGEGVKASIILKYTCNFPNSSKSTFIKVKANKNSELTIIELVDCPNNTEVVYAVVDSLATLNFININLSKTQSSLAYYADMSKAYSNNNVDIGYLAQNGDELDFNIHVVHNAPYTKSNVNLNGILLNRSKKIAKYTIDFRSGSKGSLGHEQENVMIAGNDVINTSLPILLCNEDDVSGQHATSVGRIDEEILFYLMSRGLDLNAAKELIIIGCMSPTVGKIDDEIIREYIYKEIKGRCNSYEEQVPYI
jgi:Fe-S cluster assembly scaffold protein SufB